MLPAGAGAKLDVVLTNAAGTPSQGAVKFSYLRPTITEIQPKRVLTGPTSYNFTILGANLATPADSANGLVAIVPSSLSVGGHSCTGGVKVISSSEVKCFGVSA